MNEPTLRRHGMRRTAWLVAAALAAQPFAPLGRALAQDAVDSQRVAQRVDDAGASYGRFVERLNQLENDLKIARARIAEQRTELDAAHLGLGALAKSLGQLEGVTQVAADRLAEAKAAVETPDTMSDTVRQAINEVLGTVEPGEWASGLTPGEAVAKIDQVKQAAKQAQEVLQQRRESIDVALREACAGVDPSVVAGLSLVAGAALGAGWSAELVVAARSAGVELPPCVTESDAPLDQYEAERKAAEQMNAAVSGMMTAAMATLNPYVIAAAVAVMAIMAIISLFSDDDGGGGGSEETGVSEGGNADTTVALGQNEPTDEPDPAGELGNDAGEGPGADPTQVFVNVAPGVGVTVTLIGSNLVFTDPTSALASWTVRWGDDPPRARPGDSGEGKPLPNFSSEIWIMSVDLVKREFVVELTPEECDSAATIVIREVTPDGALSPVNIADDWICA